MANYSSYYYNQCIRKSVVAFGACFNGIVIRRDDDSGTTQSLRVPIEYSSAQKYITILQGRPKTNEVPVQLVMPRMCFQIQNMYYDSSRKLQPTQRFRSTYTDSASQITQFVPVPYNISMSLSILAKNQDDGLQIIEQILPLFHPALNVTIQMVQETLEEKDIAIVLDTIALTDDFEGDYVTRNYLEWTLNFTVKTFIYGPVTSGKDIRKVIVDYHSNVQISGQEVIRYEAVPLSTDVPPKNVEEIDPTIDPFVIIETISERHEDDDYFVPN